MKLRGIDFGCVINAPGARGMRGNLFFHQKPLAFLHLWEGVTFAAKTVTWEERKGNMPLRSDGDTPAELFPNCIFVDFFKGLMLNCVGLSNLGVLSYLRQGIWRNITKPFVLSYSPSEPTRAKRLSYARFFANALKNELPNFSAEVNGKKAVALHINFGCPNTRHDMDVLFADIDPLMDIFAEIDIPLLVNFGPTAATSVIVEASRHEACDGIWLANTVPWGSDRIDWEGLFGTTVSPLLEKFGLEGGLSGPPCLPLVVEKVKQVRRYTKKPIIGGNGIRTADDVRELLIAGVDGGVAIGSVATVRPFQVRAIVNAAHRYFGR